MILKNRVRLLYLALLCGIPLPGCGAQDPAEISSQPGTALVWKPERTHYLRGEMVPMSIQIESGPQGRGPGQLTLKSGDTILQQTSTPALEPGKNGTWGWSLDSVNLSPGEHLLTLTWQDSRQELQTRARVEIVEGIPDDAMPVWLWIRGLPSGASFYKELGFTSVGGPLFPHHPTVDFHRQLERVRATAERGVAEGIQLSPVPQGGIWRRDFTVVQDRVTPEWDYQGAWRREDHFYDPFHPDVQQAQIELNEAFFATLAPFPNWKFAFVDMEIQDHLNKPSFSPHARPYLEEELLLPPDLLDNLVRDRRYGDEEVGPAEFIAPGVVPDYDARLMLTRATYQGGNGVNGALARVKLGLIDQGREDVLLVTNPYRGNMLKGVHAPADVLASWTYTNPDPKYTLFSETLRAGAGEHQYPMHIITLLNYPGMLAPTDQGWTLMSPDMAKLCSWIDLSRAPRLISFFFGSQVSPTRYQEEPLRVPQETTDAIREMAEKVYRPLGSLIRKLDLAPRQAAVLNSQVARLHSNSPRLVGYAGQEILPFQAVLEMAHIPADVLLDEDVEDGRLADYTILFLPKTDAVTETMYQEILAFMDRGGIVVADQYLGPELPGAIRVDYDFTHRSRVNADAINRGVTFADWDDQVMQEDQVDYVKARGTTAEQDQALMEAYAADLRQRLDGALLRRVEADSPRTLLSLAQLGQADYLFVLNDNRTYSERLRPFRSQLDELVPQDTTVTLLDPALRQKHLYDLVENRPMGQPAAREGTVSIHLDRLGGKLIALYPRPVEILSLEGPSRVPLGGKSLISVRLTDKKGNLVEGGQPVRLTISNAKGEAQPGSGYYLLKDGQGSFPFHATFGGGQGTWSLQVTDLSAGLQEQVSFEVMPPVAREHPLGHLN